ncbi:MAG: bifunctional adenosylcobinamide kinase/adenosylcobinamide-phosphate guanylyltransferase [Pseudomonadota bacterium]
MKKTLPHRCLVLGGANSGKSAYAEKLCDESGLPKYYIATAQAFDDEMKAKIERHRARRGPEWLSVEAPLDLADAIAAAPADAVVLLDCVTLWLSNQLLAGNDMTKACQDLHSALQDASAPIIVVSNEVGQGIVPETSLGRRFRGLQGALNQDLAKQADRVVAVMAGLPLVLKEP